MKATSKKLGQVLANTIVREDCYQIRRMIGHRPATVIDIGANVGFFSMTARVLFPWARVIAVEPTNSTFKLLMLNTRFLSVERHREALSKTRKVQVVGGIDSGSNFTTATTVGTTPEASDVTVVDGFSLEQMFRRYEVDTSKPYVLKIDCEGGEWSLCGDTESENLVIGADHVAMELHFQCQKWPHALRRESAERWVRSMRRRYRASGGRTYYIRQRKGGLLIMKRGRP